MKKKAFSSSVSARNMIGAFAVAAFSLLSVACSTDGEQVRPDHSGDNSGLIKVTLGATIADEGVESRIKIKDNKTSWSENEEDFLFVYGAADAFVYDVDKKDNSFKGSLSLTEAQKIYAIYDVEDSGVANITEDAGGNIVYAMVQQATQEQNTGKTGVINTVSLGKEIVLYGVSDAEVSATSPAVNITMKHATAVQDFVFTDIPAATNGTISSLEFRSSEPFLTSASLDMATGVVTPVEYATDAISVAILLNAVEAPEALTSMTVRVSLLPQVVKATAEWSVVITLTDGSKYIKEFGASTIDYTYASGDCASTAIAFGDMTSYEEDLPAAALNLQNITMENTADSDVWTVACGEIEKAGIPTIAELATLREVLSAAVADGRDITLIFSDATSIVTGLFKGNTDVTVVEFPVATVLGNASAFEGCTSLRSFKAPLMGTGTKQNLGNKFFTDCTALTSVNAPDGEVGVYISDAITSFGNYTFQRCSAIPSLHGAALSAIGNSVFEGCTWLTSLEIATTATSFKVGTNLFGQSDDVLDLSKIDLVTGAGNGTIVDLTNNTWSVGDKVFTGFKSITTK